MNIISSSPAQLCHVILKYANQSLGMCPELMAGDHKLKLYPKKVECNGTSATSKDKCIYDIDDTGQIEYDPCGGHLTSCEIHICNDTYFKCPGFYCIPFRFVCDGRFHCPGGMEEKYCHRTSCSGKFRCYKTANSNTKVICIHPISICDENGQLDCPYGDDEYFCIYSFPACPLNCTCLLFSIVCNKANSFDWDQTYPHISVNISRSNISGGFWKCHSGGTCILHERVCNGYTDCYNGSDELNCENWTCLENLAKFYCSEIKLIYSIDWTGYQFGKQISILCPSFM